MLGFLLKAGLVVAAAGLGLDLLKHLEENGKKEEEPPRLPLLKDQEMPNTPVDLPKVMPMTHKDEDKED